MFGKIIESIKNYMRWGNARLVIVRCSFLLITVCASILGYKTFGKFGLLFGSIIFAAMIAYDLVLAPSFPNIVHYLNRIAAIIFSITLLVFVGLSSGLLMVADKSDPTLSVINESISFETSVAISETESTSGAGFAMTGDNKTLKFSKKEASEARNKARDLLNEKKDYIEEKGGKYMDPSIVVYKVMADWYNKLSGESEKITPDEIATIAMIIVWIAIISIQTVLSAEVHGIRIYRPSVLGGIKLLLLYIFDIRNTVIDGWKGNPIDYTQPDTTEASATTEGKKKQPDDSEIGELLPFTGNSSEPDSKPFKKPTGKHTKNREKIKGFATEHYQKHGRYPKYQDIQTACRVGPNTVAEVMKELKSSAG